MFKNINIGNLICYRNLICFMSVSHSHGCSIFMYSIFFNSSDILYTISWSSKSLLVLYVILQDMVKFTNKLTYCSCNQHHVEYVHTFEENWFCNTTEHDDLWWCDLSLHAYIYAFWCFFQKFFQFHSKIPKILFLLLKVTGDFDYFSSFH